MRITTSVRYGLRVMLDLALHSHEEPVLRQDIAARQEISAEYIAQIIRHLSKAGLVESTMGPGGGYRLARPANQVRVGDIFRAVDGPIDVVVCIQPDNAGACQRASGCAARVLWSGLSKTIESFLDAVTLEDLSAIARQLNHQPDAGCQNAIDTLELTVDDIEPCPKLKITN